ncbi:MAG TPA: hypothetical protein VJT13_21645 [Xanthobacteraceae bacterium]|nr:hypothetical protein [Xanthobacteraceae bacterium]
MNYSRTVIPHALLALATCASALAQVPEARFLPFNEELRRARSAIGPEAECRVIIEEVLARCELRVAGGHAIQIHFSDVPAGMMPRKSLTLARGTIEPQQFSAVLAAYGIPTEVAAPCLSSDAARSSGFRAGYAAYVGDYNVTCDRDLVSITYARKF